MSGNIVEGLGKIVGTADDTSVADYDGTNGNLAIGASLFRLLESHAHESLIGS